MINNPKIIEEIIERIKKLSKEDLDRIIKEVDELYNKQWKEKR